MFNKLREQLKELINESTSQDDLKKIATLSSTIDSLEEENKQLKDEMSSIKNDYIDLVKSSGFKCTESPTQAPEAPTPRTLDQIFADMTKGGK